MEPEGPLAAPPPGTGGFAAALGPGAPDADALASLLHRNVAPAQLLLQLGHLTALLVLLLLPLLRWAQPRQAALFTESKLDASRTRSPSIFQAAGEKVYVRSAPGAWKQNKNGHIWSRGIHMSNKHAQVQSCHLQRVGLQRGALSAAPAAAQERAGAAPPPSAPAHARPLVPAVGGPRRIASGAGAAPRPPSAVDAPPQYGAH